MDRRHAISDDVNLLGLTAVVAPAACGARTPLGAEDRSAAPRDDAGRLTDVTDGAVEARAPRPNVVEPPNCGVSVPVGGVRFTAERILGQVAIAPDGTIFAPRADVAGPRTSRHVVAFDACGKELWSAGDLGPQTKGYGLVARLSWADEVLITSAPGAASTEGPFRFTTTGQDLGAFSLPRGKGAFIGVPRGFGPAVVSSASDGLLTELSVLDAASGDVVMNVSEWHNDTSCAIKGTRIGCFDQAYDLGARRKLWSQPYELIDGTYRHATPSAIAGDVIYTGVYGIATYSLVARELETGRERWRTLLYRSSGGQRGLHFGAPVVGADGTIYVYLALSEYGALSAVARDGSVRWSYDARGARERFFEYGTHVVGHGGIVYLAEGATLSAIGVDGKLRWSSPIPGGTSTASPVLSPNGDLALHTDADRLVVFATGSAGVAESDWPALGGDERNANTRD